jgi:formylglycine-generating enzyme required for sulfatase activity
MKKILLTLLALTACSVTMFATVKGDVNGDGSVTSADVTALYNYLLNGETSSLQNGDVNSDGNITSADVTYVYNILLGNLPPEFAHVYILGEVNGNMWSPSNGVEMTTEDGKIYTAAITTDGDYSYNYFSFTTKLADPASSTPWDDIAPYRFGAVSAGDYNFIVTEELLGTEIALTTENYLALQMAHGSFNLRIDLENMKLTVTGEFAPQGITEYTVRGVNFKMVDVEGGTFTMGNPNYQSSDNTSNEGPVHQVTLSSYSIGQTEVTQELWQAVMGSNPSYYSGTNLPVEQVSWNQCQAFVAKLNQMLPIEGYEWRLPTEAQWEYAARGGSKSQGYQYSGSNTIGDVAWYQNNSSSKTHQVATKAPNELDIYDMSGNVEEWCQDHYANYSSSPQIDPCVSTGTANFLVNLRGGFYSAAASLCRNTRRDCWDPDQSSMEIGLRLALVPKDEIEFYVNGVSFKMIRVTGGTFMMGASDSDNEAYNNERPAHQVTLSSYYIGQTEVTQELWQALMGENPSYFVDQQIFVDWGMYITYTENFQRPVEQVTWDDCQEFVDVLSLMTDKHFRLPTEAEWEFAARGGNKSKGYKYAGSNNIDAVARYGGREEDWSHAVSATPPDSVATKFPNELGLYDMSGNVEEWCQDWYGDYSAEAQINPLGPSSGLSRVCRGGSIRDDARRCRTSARSVWYSNYSRYIGLRLVMSAE